MKKMQIKDISILGAGYVGTSLAAMISQHYNVALIDLDLEKINKINKGIAPIEDERLQEFLSNRNLKLKAMSTLESTITESDLIIICLPTDFNEICQSFDTSIIESALDKFMEEGYQGLILVKSTVPIGFTDKMNRKYETNRILFSPEFLREGNALQDNLYPSRIIIGGDGEYAKNLITFLQEFALNDPPLFQMSSSDAEAVKLFSNTYLATRISYFNELDTFCMLNGLNAMKVIEGVCSDSRIGNDYNNPSFGYGGYCLPKDTKQLNSQTLVKNGIISASISANEHRIDAIAQHIASMQISRVGVYRLIMKQGSDNFRESAIIRVIEKLLTKGIEIKIYEPRTTQSSILNCIVENELQRFKDSSDLIIANRLSKDLNDVSHKVFTRDLFNIN